MKKKIIYELVIDNNGQEIDRKTLQALERVFTAFGLRMSHGSFDVVETK